MAVSLPPCGVKVTILAPATCARLRRGDSAVSRCRELSLEVVDCAGLWTRKGHGLVRFVRGRERRCRKERCAMVCPLLQGFPLYWRSSSALLPQKLQPNYLHKMISTLTKNAFNIEVIVAFSGYAENFSVSDVVITSCVCQQLQIEIRGFEKLFNPGDFDSSKLTVRFEDSANTTELKSIEGVLPRKYTLTHSDVTGELLLSIGPSFNRQQLSDWYTRLMRDEIVAEWRGSEQVSLHVHCHVSGGHVLLAPAALRNSIFEREMPLVLEAIRHGDKDLLAGHPELHASTVWVHFHSSDPAYNRADCYGPLFYAASPIRRVTGKLVPSCISEPFTPLTLVKVQKDPAELWSVMSP